MNFNLEYKFDFKLDFKFDFKLGFVFDLSWISTLICTLI